VAYWGGYKENSKVVFRIGQRKVGPSAEMVRLDVGPVTGKGIRRLAPSADQMSRLMGVIGATVVVGRHVSGVASMGKVGFMKHAEAARTNVLECHDLHDMAVAAIEEKGEGEQKEGSNSILVFEGFGSSKGWKQIVGDLCDSYTGTFGRMGVVVPVVDGDVSPANLDTTHMDGYMDPRIFGRRVRSIFTSEVIKFGSGEDWVEARAVIHEFALRGSEVVDPPVVFVNREGKVQEWESKEWEGNRDWDISFPAHDTEAVKLVGRLPELYGVELLWLDWNDKSTRLVRVIVREGVGEVEYELIRKCLLGLRQDRGNFYPIPRSIKYARSEVQSEAGYKHMVRLSSQYVDAYLMGKVTDASYVTDVSPDMYLVVSSMEIPDMDIAIDAFNEAERDRKGKRGANSAGGPTVSAQYVIRPGRGGARILGNGSGTSRREAEKLRRAPGLVELVSTSFSMPWRARDVEELVKDMAFASGSLWATSHGRVVIRLLVTTIVARELTGKELQVGPGVGIGYEGQVLKFQYAKREMQGRRIFIFNSTIPEADKERGLEFARQIMEKARGRKRESGVYASAQIARDKADENRRVRLGDAPDKEAKGPDPADQARTEEEWQQVPSRKGNRHDSALEAIPETKSEGSTNSGDEYTGESDRGVATTGKRVRWADELHEPEAVETKQEQGKDENGQQASLNRFAALSDEDEELTDVDMTGGVIEQRKPSRSPTRRSARVAEKKENAGSEVKADSPRKARRKRGRRGGKGKNKKEARSKSTVSSSEDMEPSSDEDELKQMVIGRAAGAFGRYMRGRSTETNRGTDSEADQEPAYDTTEDEERSLKEYRKAVKSGRPDIEVDNETDADSESGRDSKGDDRSDSEGDDPATPATRCASNKIAVQTREDTTHTPEQTPKHNQLAPDPPDRADGTGTPNTHAGDSGGVGVGDGEEERKGDENALESECERGERADEEREEDEGRLEEERRRAIDGGGELTGGTRRVRQDGENGRGKEDEGVSELDTQSTKGGLGENSPPDQASEASPVVLKL
jgi:hypothetical protein